MQIKLNLVKSLIIESVKAETYIKGEIDKSSAQGINKLAYNEQAGDDEHHERKLVRTMYTALGELKGMLSNYLDNSGTSSGDNIVSEVEDDTDSIVLTINVSSRFNKAYSDSLAKLCSKYIEDKMLVLWWGTINQNQAAFYSNLVTSDIDSIERCFNKTAPSAPKIGYTTKINLMPSDYSTLDMNIGDEEQISYSIDAGALDDIEILIADENIAKAYRTSNGFSVFAANAGVTTAKLFSLHNDTVSKIITIQVPAKISD